MRVYLCVCMYVRDSVCGSLKVDALYTCVHAYVGLLV